MTHTTSTKLLFYVLISVISSYPSHAQFILAGAHGSAGYHHDYSPDAPLHAYLTMNIIQNSIDLDMNNDGTMISALLGQYPSQHNLK